MKHGSLFSGIGGFDYAAQMMGWENLFHCEWNPFGQKVLKHHWPQAESFHDITKTDFTPYANRIDILTGGFPCQPYSLAGKRKGKEDERHLWPEMLRAIREIQPRWVVGENVFGLINWSDGLVFHEVQVDLEAAGYEVFPYVLPAAAVNAPHRRDRVWFVAHLREQRRHDGCDNRKERHIQTTGKWKFQENKSERHGRQPGIGKNGSISSGADTDTASELQQRNESGKCGNQGRQNVQQEHWESDTKQPGTMGKNGNATNTNSDGQHRCHSEHEINPSEGRINAQCDIEQMGRNVANTCNTELQGREFDGSIGKTGPVEGQSGQFSRSICTTWEKFPTQSPICTGNDGFPTELDGITFSKWRNESIKSAGNAIVPQVAFQIFKSIEQYENL